VDSLQTSVSPVSKPRSLVTMSLSCRPDAELDSGASLGDDISQLQDFFLRFLSYKATLCTWRSQPRLRHSLSKGPWFRSALSPIFRLIRLARLTPFILTPSLFFPTAHEKWLSLVDSTSVLKTSAVFYSSLGGLWLGLSFHVGPVPRSY